jgi:hypothetical protein
VILALLLAGCGRSAEQAGADYDTAGTQGVPAEPDAAWPEADEPDVAPAARLEEVQAGPPEDVARLLLQWDTAGLRLEGRHADALTSLYCYQPEQQCQSDEPAWDFVLAVDGFMLEPVVETADSAQYVITFDEVGTSG